LKNDPTAVMNRFESSWKNLLAAFAEPLVQPKLDIMNKISDAMNNLAKWAVENPGAIENLAKGLVALSSAMIVGGLGMLVAGPAGGLIGALAGTLGLLIALRWDTLKNGLDQLKEGLQQFFDWIIKEADYWTMGAASALFGGHGGESASSVFGRMRHMSDNKSWLTATGTNKEHLDYIRSGALARGIDPNVVSQLVANEGLGHYVGDGGTSFGDFQLHRGGGLGDAYERLTGHSLNNTMDWKHQADWSLDWMAAHKTLTPWHGWHGASGAGLSGAHPVEAAPHHRHVPGFTKHHQQQTSIENVIVLDGKEIARSTNRHMVQAATHPTTAPYHDGSRHWTPPDAGLVGV
jgi:hypothetical protein